MGEVYKARDTKLDRDVAVKVLPAAVSHDPDRLARFEREARVLASLNHPNIAQIYAVEDGALVMEFVQGKALAGPLRLETALDYAPADHRSSGSRARQGHHPSRFEARQSDGHAGGRRQSARLRPWRPMAKPRATRKTRPR
jgi:hypothetical protein